MKFAKQQLSAQTRVVDHTAVLSKFRKCFWTNSSPEGRGWPEGPGEGSKDSSLHPSPAASRHPLPSGEEFVKNTFPEFGQHCPGEAMPLTPIPSHLHRPRLRLA